MAGEPSFPTTNSVDAPSVGSSKKRTPRILVAAFGDGFSQRAGDGVNPSSRSYSLTWTNMTTADADLIDDFLDARQGFEAFLWTPPRESADRKLVCKEWSRTYGDGLGSDSLTATFVEVHDL